MQDSDFEKLEKLQAINALVEQLADQVRQSNPLAKDRSRRGIVAAKAEFDRRRHRARIFQKFDILSDPGWEILLELYIADASGKKLSLSSIGLESGVSPSTTLRWVRLLEEFGLIRRSDDVHDRRRHWLWLTAEAKTMLDAHFSQAAMVG